MINQDEKPGTVLSAGALVDVSVSLGSDRCKVYWRSVRNGDQRCPRTHSVISDLCWNKLRWTAWNAREAIGTGREVYRNGICSGVPVRCRDTSVPLRIRLTGTKMCAGGARIYSRISAVTYSANGRRVTGRAAWSYICHGRLTSRGGGGAGG